MFLFITKAMLRLCGAQAVHQDLESCYNQMISWYVRLCVHYLGNTLLGPSVDSKTRPVVKTFHFEEFDVSIGAVIT